MQIKCGMILFLFQSEKIELYLSDGIMNLNPHAFSSSGKQFLMQVGVSVIYLM